MVKLDFTKFKPEQGKLLISEPFMNDPNFRRTVVLLANHNEEGSIGFVLNRSMDLKLEQIVEEFSGNPPAGRAGDFPVCDGGPVQRDSLFFVHTLGDAIPDSINISGDLYWGGNFETVKALLHGKNISQNEIRLFIGYSGWGPGQLQEEIKRNSWLVAPASIDVVMTNDWNKLWKEVLKGMGKDYGILANFPENPMWN